MEKNSVLITLNKTQLSSKYEACMLGGVLGDCIGAKFEFLKQFPSVSYNILQKHVWPQQNKNDKASANISKKLRYTDDTAMTISVANSLITKDKYNSIDMANRFASEYDKDPDRGYGDHVSQVFYDICDHKYKDVYESSRRQFDGSGSYGNGAAMRVAPVALYAATDINKMIKIAADSSRLTHAHVDGINGAILQCLAIHEALSCGGTTDPLTFITALIDTFTQHVTTDIAAAPDDMNIGDLNKPSYTEKLRLIQSYFHETAQPDVSLSEIQNRLGCSVSAKGSVPTAIYCFLRTLSPIDGIDFDNGSGLARCIIYSVSLGGDTDTIASMAASIAGAYYGLESVLPSEWVSRCEGTDKASELADKLLNLALKHKRRRCDALMITRCCC